MELRAWLYATVAHGFRKKDGSRVVEALDTWKRANQKNNFDMWLPILSCTHESTMKGDIKVANIVRVQMAKAQPVLIWRE